MYSYDILPEAREYVDGMPAAALASYAVVSGWLDLTGRMVGGLVVVEPLRPEHEHGLFEAGHDREMWTYLTAFPNAFETRERFHRWMGEALAATPGPPGAPPEC